MSVLVVDTHAAALLLVVLLVAPSAQADVDPPRRRGLDVEAHLGVVGSLTCDVCALDLGRTAGGTILFRALPHLALGMAGDAMVLPVPGNRQFPVVTVYTGFLGPTVRGYFVGRGPVDGFVALTVGGMPYKQSPPALGFSGLEGYVAVDQAAGAEIRLARRVRFSPSVGLTWLLGGWTNDAEYYPDSPPFGGIPQFTLSVRLGWTFAIIE